MSDFKEFEGKDLDDAIGSACDYFNLNRDRLEIEIMAGGSSGIFGIMGVKKAKVKARPRAQVNTTDIINGKSDKPKADKPKADKPKADKPKAKLKSDKPKAAPKPKGDDLEDGPAPGNVAEPEVDLEVLDKQVNGNRAEPEPDLEALDDQINGNVDPEVLESRQRKPRERKPRQPKGDKGRGDKGRRERKPRQPKPERKPEPAPERPRASLDEFDAEVLTAAVTDVMTELLKPIVGETKLEVTIETDRVSVFIDDEENSGLIIGREGQTLSSLQYLVNRLVSRKMEASIRIQVDTGDYRERQDDKLRQIAQHLADKADNLGRTQSTKPLSSYHRRVVHLALQENEDVFTRSKGDGPMKRVLIVPKNRKNNSRSRN